MERGAKMHIYMQGSSWALTVVRSDFSLQENYGRSDSKIGRSYSAKLRHFLSV